MASPISLRRRNDSLTSRRFYQPDPLDKKLISLIETCESAKAKQQKKIKQSKHLPYWVWYLFAKINGVPLKPNERPILGTVLHMLTFTCAFTYATTHTWYVVYDIITPKTKRDIPRGTMGILLVFYWCGFGYYCKTLISRLFLHERFLKDVRMHSRTVFKINASFLVLVLGLMFSAANIYETFIFYFELSSCDKIELNQMFCDTLAYSNIIFTIFTLVWHTLLSFVFMSVCRTHTIGLRCFSEELEHDALVLQLQNSSKYKRTSKNCANNDLPQNSTWSNTDDEEEDTVPYRKNTELSTDAEPHIRSSNNTNQIAEQPDEIAIILSPVIENSQSSEAFITSGDFTGGGPMSREMTNVVAENDTIPVQFTVTTSEILHNFWKINRRLRFSSSALQRWFASFVTLVLLRCSTYLVNWLSNEAAIYDVLQFILPLIVLVVLSTALAEVNFEGQRFLRSVYPTNERLKMLQYLSMNPLQMPIYGFGMTHGTIVTVIFAILIGFVTRIVITEISK